MRNNPAESAGKSRTDLPSRDARVETKGENHSPRTRLMAAADDGEFYSDLDQAALEACIAEYAAESPAQRLEVERELAEDWEAVAHRAVYACQYKNLRLQVYQYPPAWVSEDDSDDGLNNCDQRDARALLRKMLAASISRYHPDPMGALCAAARKNKRTVGR